MAGKATVQSAFPYREMWYTNMILLGFNPSEQEEQSKVPINVDMFSHINKKGSELVLHFLLSVLAPELASQRFRDCWPICDKKHEQDFRKTCVSWLGDIAKEHPDTKLPRLCASLLLSPGGDKYYVFLYKLSKHVQLREILRQADQNGVFVSSFLTNGIGDIANKEIAMAAMQAHTVRNVNKVVNRLSTQSQLHSVWEETSSQLVREYQTCSKEVAQLQKQLTAVREEHSVRASSVNPPRTSADERVVSVCGEVAHRQRAGRLHKTREMWVCLENFERANARPRDVVESVIATGGKSPSLNARHLTIHVPDLLLTEYREMVATEGANPLYQGGKLDLVSLTKLYNLALQKYRDCLSENEVPDFDEHDMMDKLQQQRTLLATVTQLGSQLEVLYSSLDLSVKARLTELQEQKATPPATPPICVFKSGQAPQINITHLPPQSSVGLLPPSPKHHSSNHTHISSNHTHISDQSLRLEREVSSPEAIRDISVSVHKAAVAHAHRTLSAPTTITPHTGGPTHTRHTGGPTHTSHTSGPTHTRHTGGPAHPHKRSSQRSKRSVVATPTPLSHSTAKQSSCEAKSSEGVWLQEGGVATGHSAMDTLADQIAVAVSSQTEDQPLLSPSTPVHQLHSIMDPLAALGQGAFVSKDLIPRTPQSKALPTQASTPQSRAPPIQSASPPEISLATPPPPTLHTLPTPPPPTLYTSAGLSPPITQLIIDHTPSVTIDHTPPLVPTDQLISFETPVVTHPPSDVPRPLSDVIPTTSPQTPLTHVTTPRRPHLQHTPTQFDTTALEMAPTSSIRSSLEAMPTTPETWLADIEPPTPCPEDFDPSSDEGELSIELSSETS